MPVQIQYQPDDIYVLRISGILKRSEFAAEQSALARQSTADRNLGCWLSRPFEVQTAGYLFPLLVAASPKSLFICSE